jgi:tRNA nucleotidyltransferase (CCA-adding enzyme)
MARDLCHRLRLPSSYGKASAWVSRLHGTFNTWSELRDSTKLRMADQAIKAGIVETLPLVAAADKMGGTEPEEWRVVVRIAGMATAELGLDRELLEQVEPDRRSDAMLQARIRKLRGS